MQLCTELHCVQSWVMKKHQQEIISIWAKSISKHFSSNFKWVYIKKILSSLYLTLSFKVKWGDGVSIILKILGCFCVKAFWHILACKAHKRREIFLLLRRNKEHLKRWCRNKETGLNAQMEKTCINKLHNFT